MAVSNKTDGRPAKLSGKVKRVAIILLMSGNIQRGSAVNYCICYTFFQMMEVEMGGALDVNG